MRRVPGWMVLFAGVAFSALASAAESPPTGKLPRTAMPLHYSLDFRVDPRREDFEGITTLRLALGAPADHLWLHGKQLDVRKVEITDAAGKSLPGKYRVSDATTGVARIDFGKRLPAQEISVRVEYRAPFNHQLEGLYKSEHAGRPYVVSQMEPISARFAFPSLDEPSFKTPFDIALEVPADNVAVANTKEVARRALADGWTRVSFQTTPPLPTYLIAIAVGPWDVIDGPTIAPTAWRTQPVALRGIAAHDEGKRLAEVLAGTPDIVTALEDYFGHPYEFGKLDLLAAPDFSAGAMENPGLIVFRDSLMLLDANTPVDMRRASFNVNAHELSHQWFGDTVTMPWWDDIWLNEAFATWMQGKITQQLRPAYRADLDRIKSAQEAMDEDSLANARRIRQPIGDSGDIEGAFDGITYSKGAAVLGMFEAYLGVDTFRRGIRQYVKDHALANATADDLVAALAKAGDQGARFEKAMKSFLDKPGVPLLSTRLDCKAEKATLHIVQQRYLPLGSTGDAAQKWGIPLCLRLAHGKVLSAQCVMVDDPETRIALDGGCPDWYLPNADGRGYYRFAMAGIDVRQLTAAAGSLSDAEQLTYADSIASAFDHGDLDASGVLLAMQTLAKAPTRQAATAMFSSYHWIRLHVADDTLRPLLDAWVADLYLPRLRSLGYTRRVGESEDDSLLRASLVDFLAMTVRNSEVRKALLNQADAAFALSDNKHLNLGAANADLLGNVLAVAVQERGVAAFDAISAEIAQQSDPNLRKSLIASLGATTDPALSERARNFALSDAVKIGEMSRLLGVNRAQPENRAAFWSWFQSHFAPLAKRTPAFAQGKLPEYAAEDWCDGAQGAALQKFFDMHASALIGGAQGVTRAREAIGLCDALRQHQDPEALRQWLKRAGKP
ncbi:MAG: M1 family metallopeptidase [Tahibacter sp.]